jgi:enoyl-CoA hydratase
VSQYELIQVEEKDAVAVVTINRPEKLNALNQQVIRELTQAFQSLSARVAILTGAGDKSFVAGADIAEMSEMSAAEAKAFSESRRTRRVSVSPRSTWASCRALGARSAWHDAWAWVTRARSCTAQSL